MRADGERRPHPVGARHGRRWVGPDDPQRAYAPLQHRVEHLDRLLVPLDHVLRESPVEVGPAHAGQLVQQLAVLLVHLLGDRDLLAVGPPVQLLVRLAVVLGQALPELPLVILLADAGLAVIGTLVGALAVQTRARDLIVPLLALPLCVPLLIAAAEATAPLLRAGGAGPLEGRWLAILALYDVVFGLLAYAIFDYLLED